MAEEKARKVEARVKIKMASFQKRQTAEPFVLPLAVKDVKETVEWSMSVEFA